MNRRSRLYQTLQVLQGDRAGLVSDAATSTSGEVYRYDT